MFTRDKILAPGSGMKKIQSQDLGSGIRDVHVIFEILVSVFGLKILKFFFADPDPGSCQPWIRDPGWEKIVSGLNIPDPQH